MSQNFNRISCGVKGINKMVQGGLPLNSIIGLSGPAGVGKSILALQFLLEGARQGEKCIYINLEEPKENIIRTVSSFGFGKEFLSLEDKKLINAICLSFDEFEKIYADLFRKIGQDKNVRRLVIDSFNCFFSYLKLEKYTNQKTGYEIRKILSQAFRLFREKEFTTLLILEDSPDSGSELNSYTRFMVDGIIQMDFLSFGSIERRIFIPKMRWTKQYDSSLPFEITDKGIKVTQEK
ncbi:AAA family ATPase [Candidatus Woesearchaeota archaeon]|nr:AAA family ATPase [Candidatus Woesearchaeota archaeon]